MICPVCKTRKINIRRSGDGECKCGSTFTAEVLMAYRAGSVPRRKIGKKPNTKRVSERN